MTTLTIFCVIYTLADLALSLALIRSRRLQAALTLALGGTTLAEVARRSALVSSFESVEEECE